MFTVDVKQQHNNNNNKSSSSVVAFLSILEYSRSVVESAKRGVFTATKMDKRLKTSWDVQKVILEGFQRVLHTTI